MIGFSRKCLAYAVSWAKQFYFLTYCVLGLWHKSSLIIEIMFKPVSIVPMVWSYPTSYNSRVWSTSSLQFILQTPPSYLDEPSSIVAFSSLFSFSLPSFAPLSSTVPLSSLKLRSTITSCTSMASPSLLESWNPKAEAPLFWGLYMFKEFSLSFREAGVTLWFWKAYGL